MTAELSANDWIKRFEEAGFDGRYRATCGDLVITGQIGRKNKQAAAPEVQENRAENKHLYKGKA